MNTRFEIVKKFECQYIADGLPIYIEAGAVTKDNYKNAILIQIKFRNYGLKVIKAVYISCDCYGPLEETYEPLQNYEYLDLNCMTGDDFGSQEAVYVPDSRTRSVTIHISTVLFSNGTVLNGDYQLVKCQKQIPIELSPELESYYFKCTSNRNNFYPIQYKYLWICSCGAFNVNEINECRECKSSKERIFICNNLDSLNQEYSLYLENEEKIRKEREAKELSEKRLHNERKQILLKKIKKICFGIIISTVIILGFLFAVTQFNQYQKNNKLYNEAMQYLDNYEWEKAKDVFKSLDGFKDAREQYKGVDEKKKQHEYDVMEEAVSLYEKGQYKNAYELLDTNNSYFDDFSEVDNIYYCYAGEQYNKKIYSDALKILAEISDNWIEKNNDDYYLLLGLIQYGNEEYLDASNSFSKIVGIIDDDNKVVIEECKVKASEIINEEKYQSIQALLDVYKFDEALNILREIEPYKDSTYLIEIINNRKDGVYSQIDEWGQRIIVQTDINVETLESKYCFVYVVNRELDESIEYYMQELAKGDIWARHEKERDGNVILVEEDRYKYEFKDDVTLVLYTPGWRMGRLKQEAMERTFKKEASL